MGSLAVSNSSPVILLRATNRLDLLLDAYDEVVVPEEVAKEVGYGLEKDGIAVRRVEDRALLGAVLMHNHIGEAAAIALALETKANEVILDDLRARNYALRKNLSVVGTLGLVTRAREEGRLAAARPVIDELLKAGMLIDPRIIARALARVGE